MVGVERWAEIRRMHRVERMSIREISRRTGLHRRTIRRALSSDEPPRYRRSPACSKLDPFRDWVCEQLLDDPRIPAQRLREMAAELGYEGGKTIFNDYLREVRPRYLVKRTFQRTVYRPGELVQCDLWEPREPIAVGHGQLRRGWVVTAELCFSRLIAGSLIFSKEAPDILWGLGRCLERIGALPQKLVNEPRLGQATTMDGFVTDFINMLSIELGRQTTVREPLGVDHPGQQVVRWRVAVHPPAEAGRVEPVKQSRCPYRTKAATRTPSAPDTCASTKAGVGPASVAFRAVVRDLARWPRRSRSSGSGDASFAGS